MIRVVNKRVCSEGVYIGRPSPLGNPFIIGRHGDRRQVILRYKDWLTERLKYDSPQLAEMNRLIELARKGDVTLVCWCAPELCHGDLIKKVLDVV